MERISVLSIPSMARREILPQDRNYILLVDCVDKKKTTTTKRPQIEYIDSFTFRYRNINHALREKRSYTCNYL